MEKQLKRNFLIGVIGFVAVFATLLIIASVFDLEVSHLLATPFLEKGKYYTTNGFGLFFETVGYSFFYLFMGLAGVIALRASIAMKDGDQFFFIKSLKGKAYLIVKIILIVGFCVFGLIEFRLMFHEYYDYPKRFALENLTYSNSSLSNTIQTICEFLFGAIVEGIAILSFTKVSKEASHKLLYIALTIIICAVFYILVIENIKPAFGRARFRTLNLLGDESLYSNWFEIKGRRYLDINKNIVETCAEENRHLGIGDHFKSFPSGHTYAAALSYSLILLPDLFEFKNKKVAKIICYSSTILFTGIIAIARIIAGAHFFSDVLIGGTIPFVIVCACREFIVLKGLHFKALFGKLN